MADAVRFEIVQNGSLWSVLRDGTSKGEYSHLAQATHEATAWARELQRSGEPATVEVHAQDKVIEIDVGPEDANPDLANNAADFVRLAPL